MSRSDCAHFYTAHPPFAASERVVLALHALLASRHAGERAATAWALGKFTPASLPVLFEALAHPEMAVRNAAAEGIERSIPARECWSQMLPSKSIESPRDSRVGSYAWMCTSGLGELSTALSNSSEHVRVFAAMTLWKLDRDSDPVRREIERAELDPSSAVRFWARCANARSRIRVDSKTQEVIDYCIDQLEYEDDLGGDAARELVEYGPLAVPSLIAFFHRWRFPIGDPTHGPIVWTLERLGDDGIAVLAIGLEHWYSFARAWSAQALLSTGSAADAALPAILSSWRNERDPLWRYSADHALPFWDEPQPTRRYLVLKDTIPMPHANSAWELLGLGSRALLFAIDALDDPHAIVRFRAAHALEGMKDMAMPALDALERRFDDPDTAVREAAARAVIAIAPEGSEIARRALEAIRAPAPK